MIRNIVVGCLLLLSMKIALAQGACEANFKADGDAKDGLHFATSVAVPNTDTKSLVEQLKSAAKEETWQIGATDINDSITKLTVTQKATSHSREFALFFTVNKSTNTVAFEATLPSGMTARADDTRIMMCRVLSKVKVDGESITHEAPTPRVLPASEHPDDASKTSPCPLTFAMGGSSVDGMYFTSWIPVPGMDAHTGIGFLKGITTKLGYDPGTETYHGQEGTLTVLQKPEKNPYVLVGDNTLGPYLIHFAVDDALGTMSVQAHTPKNQNFDVVVMKAKLCSMINIAAGYPPEQNPYASNRRPALNNPFKNLLKDKTKLAQEKANEDSQTMLVNTDTLFRHAMSSGKSVVIMPIINLGYKYAQAIGSPEYRDEASSTVIWQDVHDTQKTFKVGVDESLLNMGMHGYQLDVTTGKTDYLVYIVDPGTYSITGNTYDARSAHVPEVSEGKAAHVSGLGQANLIESKYATFEQKLVWHDATYANRTVHENYCTLEIVGGPCVASQTSSYNVTDKTSDAGYRNDTFKKDVDGVSVASKIEKEFASFTLAPGEVIAVDGFYADGSGNGNFQYSSCARVGGQQVQCQLAGYSLLHIPAFLDDVKKAIHPNSTTLPNMAQIFSNIQYRQLKIAAKPGSPSQPGWGKTYTLTN